MRSASSSTSTCTAAQVEHVLLVEVDQAARRADQHVDAVLELAPLLVVVDAAEGEAERQARVLAEDLGVVVDLHGEFARRGDDQRADGVRPAASAAGSLRSRCAYSATRNAAVLPVPVWAWPATSHARERLGQRLGLDRRAALEARIAQCRGPGTREGAGG